MKSSPAWPRTTSSPSPPSSQSSPGPPATRSLPVPPSRRSSPSSPRSTSLPEPPASRSGPGVPVRRSLPKPPSRTTAWAGAAARARLARRGTRSRRIRASVAGLTRPPTRAFAWTARRRCVSLAVMYDYVIVGAGSAGCVLANRLTKDPDVRVLLLEAGPPDVSDNIHVPLGYLKLARTEVDWDYDSASEPFCGGRRIQLPRGRTLGGSSSMNAMVYIRGNRADYDGWGIPGWSYDDLLPYFKRAEDNERGADEFHGAGGPLPVSESRSRNVMCAAFVDAGVEAGLPRN